MLGETRGFASFKPDHISDSVLFPSGEAGEIGGGPYWPSIMGRKKRSEVGAHIRR